MGCELCKEPNHTATGDLKSMGSQFAAYEQMKRDFLSSVELFHCLPEEIQPLLAASMIAIDFEKDAVLITQGEDGSEFFVIVSGTVRVEIDGKEVAQLGKGDHFGEKALLHNEPRNASIIAQTGVSALKIDRAKFEMLDLQNMLVFPKRQAVAGNDQLVYKTKVGCAKSDEQKELIKKALYGNKNLNSISDLDDTKCDMMIELMWEEEVVAGDDIIKQGEQGDYFYVVKEGLFDIIIDSDANDQGSAPRSAVKSDMKSHSLDDKLHEGETDEPAGPAPVGEIGVGCSFGELALLFFAPRAATIKAKEDCLVWVLDRNNFKHIMAQTSEAELMRYAKYIQNHAAFVSLKEDERLEIARNLEEKHFDLDEIIFEQGEAGDYFYILFEGEIEIIKDEKTLARLVGTRDDAQVFGELALLNAAPRAATVVVKSEKAKTLCIDKVSFEMLLGPLKELKKRGQFAGESQVGRHSAFVDVSDIRHGRKKVYRKDLTRMGLLGCGGFGAVELAEHYKTKETYALKALSKGYVLKCGQQKMVMSEKQIQYMCNSPFIVKLYETYNGDQFLYFLLELALGGELYATYKKKAFHGSAVHAKFYVGGTVFAFEHLHRKKIIYRDLKPENLLMTETGQVKLTDMGLAKVVVGKSYTTCGTPDYFSPEMVASSGHNHATDWWMVGILIFELMTGTAPFFSPLPFLIFERVKLGIDKVEFPEIAKGDIESIVKGLCQTEPSERLPVKRGGTDNIRNHAWFEKFDWTALGEGSMTPPYVPAVKSKKDLANFSARKEDMPPRVPYEDPRDQWDAAFATSS